MSVSAFSIQKLHLDPRGFLSVNFVIMYLYAAIQVDVEAATVSQCDATWIFRDPKWTANQLEDNHVTWLDLAAIRLTCYLRSS